MAAFLGWTEELARDLISFGGVYYKPGGAPASAKPKRELDPEREGSFYVFTPGTRREGEMVTLFDDVTTNGLR